MFTVTILHVITLLQPHVASVATIRFEEWDSAYNYCESALKSRPDSIITIEKDSHPGHYDFNKKEYVND